MFLVNRPHARETKLFNFGSKKIGIEKLPENNPEG
jgi:hypothetical protein